MATAEGDTKLLVLLTVGVLVVREEEFEHWYKLERARYKWPSQRMSVKPRRGRPVRRDAYRDDVLALVQNGLWRGSDGLSKLRRLLRSRNCAHVPSADTLRRLIDGMHTETGDLRLFRPTPNPRRR